VCEEFGGSILSTKQTKAVRDFYGMGLPEGNKALNVVLHGVTDLRNLAEVRLREEIKRALRLDALEKAKQYVPELPMEMKKLLPDQLPQLKVPEIKLPEALEGALENIGSTADSLLGRFKHLMDEKAPEQPETEPKAKAPTAIDPSQGPSFVVPPEAGVPTTIDPSQKSSSVLPPETRFPTAIDPPQKAIAVVSPEAPEDKPWRRLLPIALPQKQIDKDKEPKEPKKLKVKRNEEEDTMKPKTKSKSRSKKSQKGKGKQVDRENEPPAPLDPQPKVKADKTTPEADSTLDGVSKVRLSRGQSIVEIPANARVHSISDDTFLIEQSAIRPHSLDLDNVVSFNKARLSHILEHDQVIPSKPAPKEHRLSKDTVVTKPAVTPGHYLEGDPLVLGPRQVFSHEILDDPIVEQATASLPHTLESDKKIAEAAKTARAHSITTDTILPTASRPEAAHDLESDKVIMAPVPISGEHDISRDVRILSPSGQVRSPHAIDADETIREGAQFRKSPRPEAAGMPGKWGSSSGSEERIETNKNPVGSLDAVVDSADRAPGELGRLEGSGKENMTAGTYE
jgi:hypothetical protein